MKLNISTSTPDEVNLRNGCRGTQKAYVKLTADEASKALKIPTIRIGWVSCQMSELKSLTRCFKFWRYNHVATNCKESVYRSPVSHMWSRRSLCSKMHKQTKMCPVRRWTCDRKLEVSCLPEVNKSLKMKILQLNINHCIVAQDLLKQTIFEKKFDIALLSEQQQRVRMDYRC